jgi:reductive dehalogenase
MVQTHPAVPARQVDERDTMFSRAALRTGTADYQAYYTEHAELKETDDALRALPSLLSPGSTFFQPDLMAEAGAHFEAIEAMEVDPAWVRENLARLRASAEPSREIKAMALKLGAVAAGWASLDQAFVYSHKGRLPEDYGNAVSLDHPCALVFLVEMDWEEMQRAPKAPTLRESARQYRRAALVSLHLEALLRAFGCRAKQHYDAHYDVVLPPLAVSAGLGEVGRNNILIADRYGSRVRIGCVTTDFPAILDQPVDLGAQGFCEVCKKCAENCPSRALETGAKRTILDVEKWPTAVERCYRYWRQVGTDCGVCMAVCPFSHQASAFHNLVRWLVRTLPWAHRLLVWGDAAVYGRRWKPQG